MKANIYRGKLIAPKSLSAALTRQKQLDHETRRVGDQLCDPMRRPAPEDAEKTEAFLQWHGRASQALRLFQLEQRLLDAWIYVRQNDAERLLREAYEVLKVLEVQTDFDPHEYALMERLDVYFANKEDAKEEEEKPCLAG